ncbi:MAG: hypothetical protein HYR90_01400 [Candidatus Andersenbacteria bacterium]|nr:hypothetical protein [Candidatus Andersenbacteria bacterium]MBI3250813.1 hypothetical protein [Candidatus Andersenbacteria bacterium]
MDKKAKALCLVNLFEIYQKSLEDLAAVMLALYRYYNASSDCGYQKSFKAEQTPLTYTLIHYMPGEASLNKLANKFTGDSQMINGLGISNIEKSHITLLYGDIDLQKTYNFFIGGIKDLAVDQAKRLRMLNKIKHGGVVVENGRLFNSDMPKAPAAVYAQPEAFEADDHPLIIHSFKYTEEEFDLMSAGVMRVAAMMRILLSAYLCVEHRDFLEARKDLASPLDIFEKIEMKKLLSLWEGY